jgi:hypothetical protein
MAKSLVEWAPTPVPDYDMPRPNNSLPNRGRLPDLMIPAANMMGGLHAFEVPDAPMETFLSPVLVERALVRDPALRKIADDALARGKIRPGGERERIVVKKLARRLRRQVAEAVLAEAAAMLDAIAEPVAKYYLARRAAERACPASFPPEEE